MSRRGFAKGLSSGLDSIIEQRNQGQKTAIDALVQRAALKESGYDVQETPGFMGFGKRMSLAQNQNQQPLREGLIRVGGKVVSDPSYLNPLQQSQKALADARAGQQGSTLTPARQAQKDKRTEQLFGTFETNKVKRGMISDAEISLPKVPQGLFGGMRVQGAKWFNPNDPILADWQKVKTVLTDAQLLNTAKTKGAISDKEMELFAKAAANDDIQSIQRIKPIIEKLKNFMTADESAQVNAYKKIYGEDPTQWDELSDYQGSQTPSFESEDEAEAFAQENGFVGGEEIIINGVPMRYQP